MAYDPYGGQTPEQQISNDINLYDFATYGIKPSSYVQMAMVYPGMWSPSKGIRVPFLGKRIQEGRMGSLDKDVVNSFRNTYTHGFGTAVKGTTGGLWRGTKSVFAMGMTSNAGGGFVGPGMKVGPMDYNKLRSQNIYKHFKNDIPIGMKAAAKANNITLTQKQLTRGYRSSYIASMRQMKKDPNFKLHPDFQGPYDKGIKDTADQAFARAGKQIKLNNFFSSKGFKWGMRLTKAGSLIGAGMLAWDLASMAAAPLAQAGMNILNSAANTFQSRYMPEMGGQLQLSYLSQGAATERQRSIQAISKAYINGRSALGSEGSMMHDGY